MLSWAPLSKKKDGFFDYNMFDYNTQATTGLQKFNNTTLQDPLFNSDSTLSSDATRSLSDITTTINTRPSGISRLLQNTRLANVSAANIPTAVQLAARATGVDVDTFNSRQAACEGTGNGDQFDHLSDLAANQSSSSNMRCGWVYNEANPANGRGAYGTMDGPFQTTANGNWMWNLEAAKKKYHSQICSQARNCGDIGATTYLGRCGWNKLAGKAIPISNGAVAYTQDPTLSCAPENLVSLAANCPASPPPTVVIDDRGNSVAVATPASICTPLANGHFSRNCIIQKVKDAGCSDRGTLVTALQQGSDSNYIDQLSRSKAYTTYKAGAMTPLDETSLRTGGYTTTATALDDFQRVNDLASSAANQNNGLGYAARDLCFRQGEIDKFDFCTELDDNTRPNFDLDCVQRQFLNSGGQKSGTHYPTASSMTETWNKKANWKAVKDTINQLLATARAEGFMNSQQASTRRKNQEDSMVQGYGIGLESKSAIPPWPLNIRGTTVTGNENDTANINCGSGVISQVEYRYGKNDRYTTQTLTPSQCVGQNSCRTVVNNGLLGDPNPGIVKDFTATPICNTSYTTVRGTSVTGNENGVANINCGSGTIKNVEYRYGKNDRYTTQTLTPSQCVGQNSCSSVVNNGLLGDPNPGVYKDFTVTPNCNMPFEYKGCWGDNGFPNSVPPNGRALPKNLAIGGGNIKSIEDCYGLAAANGYDTFGNQYYGECWAGKSTEMNTPETSWRRYGGLPEDGTCGEIGTANNNKVFSILPTSGPLDVQTVYGNNGTVSCETYCRGTNGGPWNGELPRSWNGAKCIGAPNNPGLGCNSGLNRALTCTCKKTGTGWN